MTPPVTVVVVHYRSAGDLALLCADLRTQDHGNLDVVLVECGDDGSAAAALPLLDGVRTTVLDPGSNLGYCGGNDLGVRARPLQGDVLVVNPDVRLPDPTTVSLLQRTLHDHDDLAAVGPLIRTPEGRVEHAGSAVDPARATAVHVRTNLSAWPADLPTDLHRVPWLNGCCWLWRASSVETVGLLDERFFLFFEEVDWALRAAAAGHALAIVPLVEVLHTRSASFGASQKGSYYYWRNNHLLFRLHQGRGRWQLAWARRLLRFALAPRHLRSGASANALWGAVDALRGRTGPRPGTGRA